MSELEGTPEAISTIAFFHSLEGGGPGMFQAECFAQGHRACLGRVGPGAQGPWPLAKFCPLSYRDSYLFLSS